MHLRDLWHRRRTAAKSIDLEANRTEANTKGFPAVAAFLSRDTDHESYVFREFRYLTARNLVNLQNDLSVLEQEFKALDAKLRNGGDLQFLASMQNWEHFQVMAGEPGRDERRLKEISEQLTAKLEQYQTAMLNASGIAQLSRPPPRVLEAYNHEFAKMGIHGSAAGMLRDRTDLVALRPSAFADPLSNLVREHWPFSTQMLANSPYSHASHFEDRKLQLLVSSISVALASVLLAGSIVTLYFVTNPNARLILLLLFILLFAISIRISTSATRDSIFAATAAYAAVLVVFVSGNLGNVQPG